MELKTKYQYTYFIYPYIVNEKRYDKYILKLLKNKKCKYKIFEKEKDLDIYNYFLPNIRKYMFSTFEYRGDILRSFNLLSKERKSKIIAKQPVSCFYYELDKNIQGKVGNENGIFFNIEKIEIICFNTGICFFTMKTNLDNTEQFTDLLNFNYRFREINSEFLSLKNYENIKIQTDVFDDVSDISELIYQITGVYKKNKSKENNNNKQVANSQFYTYSYLCLDNKEWNEKNEFEKIGNEFYKYVNVLPNNYSSDFNKENLEMNMHLIDKFKYSKIGLTNLSSNLMCSGVDIYNFTKLPYEFENQYFYTYIFGLYKKMFLRKTNLEINNIETLKKVRSKFAKFTKEIWNEEVTSDDTGTLYNKTLHKTLELDKLYGEIEKKYEILYKDLNIEKNNEYSSVIILLLIFSLGFNTMNILFILYLLR